MNYETASDFDINKAVAEALSLKISSDQYMGYGDRDENVVLLSVLSEGDKAVDYCNNPSDAWPIIVENRISVLHSSEYRYKFDEWEAKTTKYIDDPNKDYVDEIAEKLGHMSGTVKFYHASDINPLRAAMIVFLKMKEQT